MVYISSFIILNFSAVSHIPQLGDATTSLAENAASPAGRARQVDPDPAPTRSGPGPSPKLSPRLPEKSFEYVSHQYR